MERKNTQVLIHASLIENQAKGQVDTMATSPAFHGLIAIMPDVHLGKGSVIGFTGKFKDLIIPNVIGVDIGCGVIAYPIGKEEIYFEELDKEIRKNVPLGFHKRENPSKYLSDFSASLFHRFQETKILTNNPKNILLELGTLGGGNHFIEIAEDENKNRWILIHTGSRNFGLTVAKYYQDKAVALCKAMKLDIPRDLEYLPLEYGGEDYLKDMRVAQEFAKINRRIILHNILDALGREYYEEKIIESVHNYIGDDNIIRKGAIEAYKGQQVIIPMNMAEGSIIGTGKGNNSYNNSAPHGAGRVFGRKVMQRKLESGEITMEQFEKSMEGIFSTSIRKDTIDESKFAYKQFDDVKKHLEETVEIKLRLKPIYNLKA